MCVLCGQSFLLTRWQLVANWASTRACLSGPGSVQAKEPEPGRPSPPPSPAVTLLQ